MLSLFPKDILGEIWDLIESVSEVFLTYFYFRYLIVTDLRNQRVSIWFGRGWGGALLVLILQITNSHAKRVLVSYDCSIYEIILKKMGNDQE